MSEGNRDAAVKAVSRTGSHSLEHAAIVWDAGFAAYNGQEEEKAEVPASAEPARRIFASDSGKGHEKTGK